MANENIDDVLRIGESSTIEFKSWFKAKNMRERIGLAVDELIAFANAKGGTVYFGIEDSGQITGCEPCDEQKLIEGIYDRTTPHLFAEIKSITYNGFLIYALSVSSDGVTYSTVDGKILKRLGKNSKPYYPNELGDRYVASQGYDFSSVLLAESTKDDVNLLEVYNMKEKLRLRDSSSTLPELEDWAFLRDLGLIKDDSGVERLTVAGLLFVGKEDSIHRLLPQAEVIYLHYNAENLEEYDARSDLRLPIISTLDKLTEKIGAYNRIVNIQIGLYRLEIMDFPEKVFQEALLNALSHRDYQSQGSIYVKHYPDRIVIENPGSFLDGITPANIITHPSKPRNKFIAETLQRLKYVQRTGQGVDIIYKEMVSMGKSYPEYNLFDEAVTLTLKSSIVSTEFVKFVVKEQESNQIVFSLAELMILRYLVDNRTIKLSEAQELTQITASEVKRSCMQLSRIGLLETVGKEYTLTAKGYSAIKSDVKYTQDKIVQYIRAKGRILDYLETNEYITNLSVRELCGYTKQQARATIDRLKAEGELRMVGKGKGSKYCRVKKQSE